MKKILCLLSIILLSFSSCTNDDKESSNLQEPIFVKETAVSINGKTYTQKMSYDGNRIQSITFQDGSKTNYIYTGDVITKVEDVDAQGKLFSIREYKYVNGKIYSCLSADYDFGPQYKNLVKYFHNEDGTVTYQKYNVNFITGEEEEEDPISGKFFFKNGNIIKDEQYLNSVLESSLLYEYDTKNNNLKNILGYNLLLKLESTVNNIIKTTSLYKTGYIGTVINVYEYNSNGYPTSKMVDVVNGTPYSIVRYQY
ncbi:hypothetical protein IRZ71_10560 [Flavobacterium sp. ANB]|uniref:hypothetical protein n=1 Tax=unclassified Flavobacterium TaxID=196869 RepID=UPI0012B6C2CE|nr:MULTISPECIES: hypothetical protein [unclassified Flavobacterium]MBF4516790.1 hypothetical protein [Flavobacterium sp. ANB]MTD69314.1 hypothetical protein [Flavobacterium sp. LC2016-13]